MPRPIRQTAIALTLGLSGGLIVTELIAGRPLITAVVAGAGAAATATLLLPPLYQSRKERQECERQRQQERQEFRQRLSTLRTDLESLRERNKFVVF